MATGTPLSYRNLVIYEIYVRAHGQNGTFADVENDLARIKNLGVDVIWFMPIHPIGKKNAKGIGCPYSITDYAATNPDYGSIDDFSKLIRTAHELDLKVMIDVVYNHTAHDSVYLEKHPQWYHTDKNGKPATTVPEWSDVIDLNHGSTTDPNIALWDSLIEALKHWVNLGVDGFRCDVASIVPLEFWLKARKEIAQLNPQVIWLAESVHSGFVVHRRGQGRTGHSDSELYQAFDITYDYDIFEVWRACVRGAASIGRYMEFLLQQDAIYPENFCKLRFVENHDQPRIMDFALNQDQALAWTSFQAFNPGAFLIYAGQESAAAHKPSLFDKDEIAWKSYEFQPILSTLSKLKKDPAQLGNFVVIECEPLIQAHWKAADGGGLYGIFNVNSCSEKISVCLPDGLYTDILSGMDIEVSSGAIFAPRSSYVFRYEGTLELATPFQPPIWHFKIE